MNKIFLRNKNGGGFWVDKDEYENSFAGTEVDKHDDAEQPKKSVSSRKISSWIKKIQNANDMAEANIIISEARKALIFNEVPDKDRSQLENAIKEFERQNRKERW